jgi:glucose-6-phosphate 1-epimerase
MATSTDINSLNTCFAIPGIVEIVAGNGNLPKIQITSSAASAEIYLQGAQLTTWKPASQQEVIFLSHKALWQEGKAIRGGIPICFPWFRNKLRAKADDPKAPAHGFARTRPWQLDSLTHASESVTATLSIEDDEASRALWPHPFRAIFRAIIGTELRLELTVINTGPTPFSFEEALHTYHLIGDAASIRIAGLDGAAYLDNTNHNREETQSGDIHLSGPTDSAYLSTAAPIEIVDPQLKRRIHIEKENSHSTIVWNPWQRGAASLADLGDEWTRMACVEAGNILSAAITLPPGSLHTIAVTLRVAGTA